MKLLSQSSSAKAHVITSREQTALRLGIGGAEGIGRRGGRGRDVPVSPITVHGRHEGVCNEDIRELAVFNSEGRRVAMVGLEVDVDVDVGRRTSLVRKLTMRLTSSVVTAREATLVQRDCTTS